MNFESPRGSNDVFNMPLSEVNIKKINKERAAKKLQEKVDNLSIATGTEQPIQEKKRFSTFTENFNHRMQELKQQIENEDPYINPSA